MKGHNWLKYDWSVEEREDGYAIIIKGDKEELKAKLEAMEAYHNYLKKAKAAGIPTHGSCKGHGFLNNIHNHFKEMHKKHSNDDSIK